MDAFIAGIANAHAVWRYVVMMAGGIAVGRMLMGWLRQEQWQPLDERLGVFFVIAIDVGAALGVLLWVFQARWDGADLLRSWRHPGLMLMGLVAAHYGWRRVRLTPRSQSRFGRSLLFLGSTGAIILLGILQIQGAF